MMNIEITDIRKRYERIQAHLKYASTERGSRYIEALELVYTAWYETVLIDTKECDIIEQALLDLMELAKEVDR